MSSKIPKIALIIAIIILIICFILLLVMPKMVSKPKEEEVVSKYSTKATDTLKELDIYTEINNKDYSKTIEVLLEDNNFKTKYLNDYFNIDYQDIDNFSKTINSLLDKDYNSQEINYIIKNFQEQIDILLTMKHINILEFKDITNFNIDNLSRYINYYNDNDYDLKSVVTYVNIGLDLDGYSKYETYTLEEAKDITILVNKYHKLPDDYEPDDLVSLEYNANHKLRKEAAEAFKELTEVAKLDNVIFYPFSPYRSFATQNVLYNRYKQMDGEKVADTYSARPGFSEHQLGLAVDVRSSTLNDNLTEEDYNWMLNNSYKYGFIIRYPKGKQFITQYIEEPWHIRYLGVELATKVHDSGLTYDEYYDLYMEER